MRIAAPTAPSPGGVGRPLQDGQRLDSICGVSSGAVIGVMITQGLARAGPATARADMRRLWQRVANAHALGPLHELFEEGRAVAARS